MGRDSARRLVKMVRPSLRADLEILVRSLVSRRPTRMCLNLTYNRLSLARKEAFYFRFAKIFRDHPRHITDGKLRIPRHRDRPFRRIVITRSAAS